MKNNNKRAILLLAFFVPVIIMTTLYIINRIYPIGPNCFMTGDLYHQYLPFLQELATKLKGGESLDYSYRIGIGSNFFALFVYYLASPFHLLVGLLPEAILIEYIGFLVIVKTGLCGLCAAYYFIAHSEKTYNCALLFSLFYAFSGYMCAYNYNIMWLDCVWAFPLVLLGLERLVEEGRWKLYCFSLGFCIFTNYYISIMICLFLVLYFGILFLNTKASRWKACVRFAVFSLLAAGLAAVLLIPEVCAIIQTDFGNSDFPTEIKTYFSILDTYARQLVGVSTEKGLNHWPNIYCGSFILVLIPMYAMDRDISIRERFCKLGLMCFMLLSFSTNVLEFVWHGLNYPDSLPGRQAFLYSFLVLTMCYDTFQKRSAEKKNQLLYAYLIAFGFILYCNKFVDHEDFTVGVKLLTLVFFTAFTVLLYFSITRKEDSATQISIYVIALVLAICECGVNAEETSIFTVDRERYVQKLEDYRLLYEMAEEAQDGFVRYEQFDRRTKCDSAYYGFPSATLFSSTLDSKVTRLYEKLGMRHSKVYYSFDGATAFTEALLNIGYMFSESGVYDGELYSYVNGDEAVSLYQVNNTLPFGYVVPTGYDVPMEYAEQPMTVQNKMAEGLGVKGELFARCNKKNIDDNVEFTAQTGGYYYGVVTNSGTETILAIGGRNEEVKYSDLKKGCIISLGYLEMGQTVTLTNGNKEDVTPRVGVDIFYLNMGKLKESLECMRQSSFQMESMTDNDITGSITMQESGRLIFSIPADKGWTVRVNGEAVEIATFGNALMAINLDAGSYTIKMHYRAPGRTAGLLLSICSVAVCIGIIISERRKQKKVSEVEKDEV